MAGYDSICCFRNKPTEKRRLLWEITSLCNLDCAFCHRTEYKEIGPDINQIRIILDKLKVLEIDGVILSGGEPLIRSDFLQIVDLVYRSGFAVDVCTNATLVSEEVAQALKKYLNEISVSFDAPNPAMHDKLRKCSGAWDAALSGIRNLQKEGIEVHTTTILNEETFDNFDETLQLLIRLGIKSLAIIGEIPYHGREYFVLRGNVKQDVRRKIDQLRASFKEVEINTKEIFPDHGYTCCDAGKNIFSLDAANNLSPCFLYKDICQVNLTQCSNYDIIRLKNNYRRIVENLILKASSMGGVCPGYKALKGRREIDDYENNNDL